MLKLIRDCSVLDDLVIPTKFTYIDLDNRCLIHRIQINEETFNHFSEKNNIKKFLTNSIIERTLYCYDGLANKDSYVVHYKEKEYKLYIPEYSRDFDIDYNFDINYDLTKVITNSSGVYYLVVAFKFDIRDEDFQHLVDSLEGI